MGDAVKSLSPYKPPTEQQASSGGTQGIPISRFQPLDYSFFC